MGFLSLFDLRLIFFLVCFSLQSQILHSQSQNLTCNSNDYSALLGFMNALESPIDGWITTSSSTPDCCYWVGVSCNSGNRVVRLELPNKRLTGNLSDSLVGLVYLQTLNLSTNFIHGVLPDSLLHFQDLQVLDLSKNDFSGFLPFLIDLPSIKLFDVTENSFQGLVPARICVNSTRIEALKLGANLFNGSLPPELENCTSLEDLCLASNYVSGTIPGYLFRLPRLTQLSLQDNLFSGNLTGDIGNPSKVLHLDVSLNGLSGNVPDFFNSFQALQYFSAHSNNFSGGIPQSLSNSRTISSLSLRNNSLSGLVTFNCSAMINLISLDLGTNQFHGSIPDNLPSCPKLRAINLARNRILGQIPESFRNFETLSYLSLSNCSFHNLSAALEVLQHCPNLTTLVLTRNFRDEVFPSDPGLHFNALKVLIIANCRLTGAIPQWLNGLKWLELLDLSWNNLIGQIPPFIGNFESLFYLDLSNNSLSGEIPHNLTRLPSLIFRNISFQEPSSDFPLFLRRNVSARGLQYNQVLSFPPTLDLSNNFLSGPILPEFGNLKKLHILDLKCNNFSGTIPSSLSGMTSLETLDLSHNNLRGTIPASLESLSFLSKFSIAYNNLTGEIPSSPQFQSFQNSSFEGNPGLCGEHASSPCQKLNPPEFVRKSRGNRGAIIGIAVGIGFGTVFLLSLLLLIILRASTRKDTDPEMENPCHKRDFEEIGSRLVVLFQNMENCKDLSIDDLLKSTDSFDQANIIGCGGFGLVYKASLPDGRKVAIKRLSGDCGQMEREFQAEVETLSRAQHPNLVLLQGYCMYKDDRLLIYPYMENGSLDFWLHEKPDGPTSLDWETRLQIARGAAKGLAYLHHSCDPHILHRDIKSSNILLNENFKAHLADFGLARLILPSDTHVTTDLVGTLGYIPPEYGLGSVATFKGDVYSFGVVLLELLTGKRPMDMCRPKASWDLISWVIQMKREKRENEVLDPFIFDKEHVKKMLWVLEVACLCLNESPKARPSTQQIVLWLDNIDVKD